MTEDCCPRCQSQQPHLHPALQHEGEVQPCPDPFHRTVTSTNTPERIAKTFNARLRDYQAIHSEHAHDD